MEQVHGTCKTSRSEYMTIIYDLFFSRMEQVHGTCKTSRSEPEDVISTMPDNVITNILNRLPLKEAVSTDILSRNWRYKWTMLTQLIFDETLYEYLHGPDGLKYFDGIYLSRLLHNFNGDITKFYLCINDGYPFTWEDVNHWVLFVCRRGIKDLTLENYSEKPPKLPSQLFSCMELEHLKLFDCFLCFVPTFRGFPNLLSLDLEMVNFGTDNFGEFISGCPSLEILKVDAEGEFKVKLGVIAKLVNLNILHFPFCAFDLMTENTSSSIFQLTCLPKLQELCLNCWGYEFIAEASVTNKVPATFLCLRTLALCDIDLNSKNTVLFVIQMISASPNLQTLKITVKYNKDPQLCAFSSLDFDCNPMGQLQLQSVEFVQFRGSKGEACLIKYILSCSPLLKKIIIKPKMDCFIEFLFFALDLLKFPRASPVAEIDMGVDYLSPIVSP